MHTLRKHLQNIYSHPLMDKHCNLAFVSCKIPENNFKL